MSKTTLFQTLGFSETDRVVISHVDDVGMCQASIQAYQDLWDFGTISSGSVMVPCPWFPAAVEMARKNPAMDLGVHLVLTSEWETYRWRPLTASLAGSSLVDQEGFFPREVIEIQEGADPDEAALELQAQIRRALQFGLDVTHIDTHMGTVAHPKFIPIYLQLSKAFKIPPLLPHWDVGSYESRGMDKESAQFIKNQMDALAGQGVVFVHLINDFPLDQPVGQLEVAKRMFGDLEPGLTHFLLHPSIDTPELRAITPDWESRVANYATFMSDSFKVFLEKEGIHLIGYRQIRDFQRGLVGPNHPS